MYKNREEMRAYQRIWARDRRAAFFAGKKCEWSDKRTKVTITCGENATSIVFKYGHKKSFPWLFSEERGKSERQKYVLMCRSHMVLHKYQNK